jgi:hypothetical protein
MVIRSTKRIQHGSGAKVKNELYMVPHAVNPHFAKRNEIRQWLSDSLVSYGTLKSQQGFVLWAGWLRKDTALPKVC